MAETAHYKLYITDDEQESFRAWREAMNGMADSNMQKIDDALFEKERVFISVEPPEGATENDTWLREVE